MTRASRTVIRGIWIVGLAASCPVASAEATSPNGGGAVSLRTRVATEFAASGATETMRRALRRDHAPRDDDAPNDDPTPRLDRAEAYFGDGAAAYARGDYDEAARHFAAAHDIAPHPFTLYNLGLAQRRAGDPLAAFATFEALEREANTPDERADAQAALVELRRELAVVRVYAPVDATVCLDGATLRPATPDATTRERRLLPGTHEVEAFGRARTLEVGPGEVRSLDIAPPGPGRALPAPRPGRRRAGLAVLGVGIGAAAAAAGLGIGAVLDDDADRMRGLTIGATAAAGVAVTSTAIGLVLLATRGRHRPPGGTEAATTTCAAG